MSNGNDQMQMEFHNSAKEIYFTILKSFEKMAKGLNRKTEEYQFQQLKKQYAGKMKQDLEMAAQNILMKHKDEKHSKEIDPLFQRFINEYLHNFIQKINAF